MTLPGECWARADVCSREEPLDQAQPAFCAIVSECREFVENKIFLQKKRKRLFALDSMGFARSDLRVLGFGVFSADVQRKLVVAQQFEVPHHVIKGVPLGRSRGIEDPRAGRAPVTPKTAFLDPDQLAYCRHLSPTPDGRLSFEWRHLPHKTH